MKHIDFSVHIGQPELELFPHIICFGIRNINLSLRNSPRHCNPGIEIALSMDGFFDWIVENIHYRILPSEAIIMLPWQAHGGENDVRNIGCLGTLIIKPEAIQENGLFHLGKWSFLSSEDEKLIGAILTANTMPAVGPVPELIQMFLSIHREIIRKELGFQFRINSLILEILLVIARKINACDLLKGKKPELINVDFSGSNKVKDLLGNIETDYGTLNKKIKKLTGVTTKQYLTDKQIKNAVRLLKNSDYSITQIAHESGFYSSQHFATVFKKYTTFTPAEYRRNIISRQK
ncbi:MAG TPA: hypothetical protein DC049_06245 [Spirochaetia bacterium]|nr:hypothetical protein [Spirochaetia bacterium]